MISDSAKEIMEYMKENNNGKCLYKHRKICDGLCNNCPYNYHKSVEREKRNGTYIPSFVPTSGRNRYDDNDYEGAILARQESYELF